ncbi:MAG: hypothetical protein ACLQUY_02480 [Ktedonobacterales bacterium]
MQPVSVLLLTLTAFRQTGSILGVALCGPVLASVGSTAGLGTACA